jgi:cytoskeletal protein CcmA (bactofilin family)
MILGTTFCVRGEVTVTEDVTIEGTIIGGPLWCEGCAVTVAATASVTGDIIARDITAFGAVSGTLLATHVVDIRPSATVAGRVVSPRLILEEGACFTGAVDPEHLEAALRVARYRRSKQELPT